jgi:hypothetical protein
MLQWCLGQSYGSFIIVSFAFNELLIMWQGFKEERVAKFLRRERRTEFDGDETLLARIPTLYKSWN